MCGMLKPTRQHFVKEKEASGLERRSLKYGEEGRGKKMFLQKRHSGRRDYAIQRKRGARGLAREPMDAADKVLRRGRARSRKEYQEGTRERSKERREKTTMTDDADQTNGELR